MHIFFFYSTPLTISNDIVVNIKKIETKSMKKLKYVKENENTKNQIKKHTHTLSDSHMNLSIGRMLRID